MAPTSIYRRPGAQHFQLVHRSQRDPLINDPEASARVLKQVDVGQVHKGKGRAAPDDAGSEAGAERRRGEASQWGILFDDSEYDYMQHLRQIGLPSGEGDVEGVLIAAPAAAPKLAQSGKAGKKDAVADMFNKPSAPAALPSEALPSTFELSMAEAQAGGSNIPLELQGLQPDMDPHLRQVLEALDDDAFLAAVPDSAESDGEEDLDGGGEGDADWLEELLLEGPPAEDEEREEFEFHEWGLEQERKGETLAKGEETWEDRFKQFKLAEAAKKTAAASASPLDRRHGAGEEDDDDFGTDDGSAELYGTEMADELGSLGGFGATGKGSMVVGAKRRARTDASGYSMSSSSMFRNKGLSTLDEQFDQIEKLYEEDSDSNDDDPSDAEYDSDGDLIAPNLVSREDFDGLLDDFLDNFEVLGNKLKPILPGTTAAEKLATFRGAMMEDEHEGFDRDRILQEHREREAEGWDEESDDEKLPKQHIIGEGRAEWDCETIISTYSTLENHPKLLDGRKPRLDPTTGMPMLSGRKAKAAAARLAMDQQSEIAESDEEAEEDEDKPRVTIARKKGESAEEKKARKSAVKDERAARRVQKKSTQNLFAKERTTFINQQKGKVAEGRGADLNIGTGRSNVNVMRLV